MEGKATGADASVMEALETGDRLLELHAALDRHLRRGFMDLASARFSRGLATAPGRLCSDDFPEGCTPAVTVKLKVDEDLAVDDLVTALRGFELEQGTPKRDGDASQGKSGLRQRKVGPNDTPEQNKQSQNEKDDHAQIEYMTKWLGMRPRGPLENSQKAFSDALRVMIELAQAQVEFQQRFGPELFASET